MSLDSIASPQDLAGPRRVRSLWPRLLFAVPLLTAAVVAAFEWSLGGLEDGAHDLARIAWLVLLLSAAQLLLVELMLLRPLRRLAAGCESMAPAPAALQLEAASTVSGLGGELDRIRDAMHQARGSLWQQDQETLELKRELDRQRQLLQEAHGVMEANQRELASLARTDTLTGLPNQRAFDEALRREFKRAQRQRGLLALAVLDLDQFKQFNLLHGTATGDAALKRVAALLSERFKRDTDVIARLGGEEFVALLPGVGMAEAQGVLELLRDELRALRLPDGATEAPLTISVGLAAASPAHPYLSVQALMQAADEALYIAKHAGRDRLSLAA
jgi:diguanylate cyclase (GGDEF)-like protein